MHSHDVHAQEDSCGTQTNQVPSPTPCSQNTHARTTVLNKRSKNVRDVTAPVGAAFPEGSLELWRGRPHSAQYTGRCERARGALTCFKGAQAHCELDADSHPFGNGRTYTPVYITSDEIILPAARTRPKLGAHPSWHRTPTHLSFEADAQKAHPFNALHYRECGTRKKILRSSATRGTGESRFGKTRRPRRPRSVGVKELETCCIYGCACVRWRQWRPGAPHSSS